MGANLYYKYAEIDLSTNMCVGIQTTSHDIVDDPIFVEIDVYDQGYVFKYCINNKWYEDAEGTIPWTSSIQ